MKRRLQKKSVKYEIKRKNPNTDLSKAQKTFFPSDQTLQLIHLMLRDRRQRHAEEASVSASSLFDRVSSPFHAALLKAGRLRHFATSPLCMERTWLRNEGRCCSSPAELQEVKCHDRVSHTAGQNYYITFLYHYDAWVVWISAKKKKKKNLKERKKQQRRDNFLYE